MKYIKFMSLSILAMAFFLLSGCSTRYQPLGLNGGYSEIKTTSDSFIVTFTGNSFTSHEKVMQYALKRAAELTIENGYKYFSVISSKDHTKSYIYSTTDKDTSGLLDARNYLSSNKIKLNRHDSSSTYSKTVIEPKLTMEIRCFNEKIISNMIDAKYFLQNN